jgi:integrase/recombinase XerD
MNPRKDIYDYNLRLEGVKRRLEKASISQRNKDLVRNFDRACFIDGLSKPRRIKLMGSLIILAEKYIRKDFDSATKEELKDIVMKIDSREDYSPWTQHSYRVIIKKFYKWLEYGDNYKEKMEYPEIVSWLRCGLKKKNQPKVKASDLLTEEEVKRLIEVAEHPRDRAFISMLYELGARIGEIGGLLIKELTRDKYGYIVDLEGKTGHRTPRIVNSDQYVTVWLNVHPLWSKQDAPLWVMIGNRTKGRKMAYAAFRALVKRLVAKAGVKKRVYPHLFRHTRVTHLLINRQINEAQAKVYFGWVPESKMLSEYSHLMSNDVNEAILAMHGIKTGKVKESSLIARQCHRCRRVNAGTAKFCQQCGSPLDVKTALELDEQRHKADELLIALLKKKPELGKTLAKAILETDLKDELLGDE